MMPSIAGKEIRHKGGDDVVRKIDRKASMCPGNPPGTSCTKKPV